MESSHKVLIGQGGNLVLPLLRTHILHIQSNYHSKMNHAGSIMNGAATWNRSFVCSTPLEREEEQLIIFNTNNCQHWKDA